MPQKFHNKCPVFIYFQIQNAVAIILCYTVNAPEVNITAVSDIQKKVLILILGVFIPTFWIRCFEMRNNGDTKTLKNHGDNGLLSGFWLGLAELHLVRLDKEKKMLGGGRGQSWLMGQVTHPCRLVIHNHPIKNVIIMFF